jgi:hypothetical protein
MQTFATKAHPKKDMMRCFKCRRFIAHATHMSIVIPPGIRLHVCGRCYRSHERWTIDVPIHYSVGVEYNEQQTTELQITEREEARGYVQSEDASQSSTARQATPSDD